MLYSHTHKVSNGATNKKSRKKIDAKFLLASTVKIEC